MTTLSPCPFCGGINLHVGLGRTLLEEAVDDIEDLASYVPKYFREKLNIEGTLAKYRAALAGGPEDLLALRNAREALVELVAVRDAWAAKFPLGIDRSNLKDYFDMGMQIRRETAAWANARAALAGAGEKT